MIRVKIETMLDQAPSSFSLGERLYHVRDVVDRWMGEDHAYYKLLVDKEGTYILRHNVNNDEWELILMDAAGKV